MGNPENPIMTRGIAYKVEGKYDEAMADFQHILAQDSNSIEGHYQLGLVYGFIGMFDESIEELLRAMSLEESRLDIRYDLAMTYSMLGMYDEAKQSFEEVLQRDPEHKKAKEQIAFFASMA